MEALLRSNQLQAKISKNLIPKVLGLILDKPTVFICIMKGGCYFFHTIIHKLLSHKVNIDLDYIYVTSYQGEERKELKLIHDIEVNVEGKQVLLIDDILDSGETIKFLTNHLLSKNATNVIPIVILKKEVNGFENTLFIHKLTDVESNKFYYGFGLDDGKGQQRGLDRICYDN